MVKKPHCTVTEHNPARHKDWELLRSIFGEDSPKDGQQACVKCFQKVFGLWQHFMFLLQQASNHRPKLCLGKCHRTKCPEIFKDAFPFQHISCRSSLFHPSHLGPAFLSCDLKTSRNHVHPYTLFRNPLSDTDKKKRKTHTKKNNPKTKTHKNLI